MKIEGHGSDYQSLKHWKRDPVDSREAPAKLGRSHIDLPDVDDVASNAKQDEYSSLLTENNSEDISGQASQTEEEPLEWFDVDTVPNIEYGDEEPSTETADAEITATPERESQSAHELIINQIMQVAHDGQPFRGPENEAANLQKTQVETILHTLRGADIEARTVPVLNAKIIKEVIVCRRQPLDSNCIRLYRGISDESLILNQVPTGMRETSFETSERGVVTVHQELEPSIEALAQEPTYKNFLDYYHKAKESCQNSISERFLDQVKNRLEKYLIEYGLTLRRSLRQQQYGFNGSRSAFWPTPYISASYDDKEAVGYASSGCILVLDVPASLLETDARADGEVALKGKLPPAAISAVIPLKDDIKTASYAERDAIQIQKWHEIEQAINSANQAIGGESANPSEVIELLQHQEQEKQSWDQEQLAQDREMVFDEWLQQISKEIGDLDIGTPEADGNYETQYYIQSQAIYAAFESIFANRRRAVPQSIRLTEEDAQSTSQYGEISINPSMLSPQILRAMCSRLRFEKQKQIDADMDRNTWSHKE